MWFLYRARPDRRQPDRKELAAVDERLPGPGPRAPLVRLVHPFAAVVAPQPERHVLVLVIGRATADANLQAPAAQVVEHGELDGQTHGMVERHLDDGEPDPHAGGPRRQRAREGNRVGVSALAGE